MKKTLFLLTLCIGASYADSDVQFGDKSWFKKNWYDAVIDCAKDGKRLPTDEEINTFKTSDQNVFSNKLNYIYAQGDKQNVICVSDLNATRNTKLILDEIDDIQISCSGNKTQMELKAQADTNRTTSEKITEAAKSVGATALDVTARAAGLAVGVVLATLPGGGGVGIGGSLIEGAFRGGNGVHDIDDKTCKQAEELLAKFQKDANQTR